MTAMPVMIVILCLMAIAYRFYSAFLAAKVAALDDSRVTPAVRMNDGQNYHPTNKWVLFGHHFAAISGAGPLIGPVLAAQFGYLPGLMWIVIGVCLGGAVQDFLVLAASMRRNGRSLAQMAYSDIGKSAGTAATVAILFILVIALAGLGRVVVEALSGKNGVFPPTSTILLPPGVIQPPERLAEGTYKLPAGTVLKWGSNQTMTYADAITIRTPAPMEWKTMEMLPPAGSAVPGIPLHTSAPIPKGTEQLQPGSPWGTFTIACTIPIALFVGLYMYKLRPGRTVEASLIGAALTLGATVLGGWVADQPFGQYFNLSSLQITWSMAIYGFVAAVLPVWVLLAPRDYLSSFLKIGTIAILVLGVVVANPELKAPAVNTVFLDGGPTVGGKIFPFLFITVMCGAISGFHSLVSSGTTPKMVNKEKDARMIGYGAMLIEGLVAVVAMTAAAALPPRDYYAMNTPLADVPKWNDQVLQVGGGGGVEHIGQYEGLTKESLRGRPGGAVTLAVGMASIFDAAARKVSNAAGDTFDAIWKYWYHFAIMFEALFILTTIDAGTRIGRFLVQEVGGKFHPKFGRANWWPGAMISTALVVGGWAWFMNSDSFTTIWKMFGIANQMLAVIALAVVSSWLVNEGRVRYVWVTLTPMAVVIVTTGSAAAALLSNFFIGIRTQFEKGTGWSGDSLTYMLQSSLIVALVGCAAVVVVKSLLRVRAALGGEKMQARGFEVGTAAE